jgi:tetratricopeptide (TPR) repeat protein
VDVLKQAVEAARSTEKESAARQGLGKLYESRGKFDSAEREYSAGSAAAKSAEQRAQLLMNLARVLQKKGDFPTAQKHITAAEEATKTAPIAQRQRLRAEAWLQMGIVKQLEGKYEKSAELVEKARKTFGMAGDVDGVYRADIAECDRLQYARQLLPARAKCLQVIKLMPKDHSERPTAEKVLGMVYYFQAQPHLAKAAHTNAWRGYVAQGRDYEAAWVEEMIADDEASIVEQNDTSEPLLYAPIIQKLESLIQKLDASEEAVWWRRSDAKLRVADIMRRAHRYEEAQAMRKASLADFERRPNFAMIPDYATFFEFDASLARDTGDLAMQREALVKCAEVLRKIVGDDNADVQYLNLEIESLDSGVEA